MWRVAPDIRVTHLGADGRSLYDPWSFNDIAQGYEEGVYQAYTDTVSLSRYVAPGNWNDADQLLIGDNGLTTAEERSQMGLWSIMGAPLIISTDLRLLAKHPDGPHFAASLAILGNPRAIAIDQDPLGAGGYRVLRDRSADDMGVDIALKPLADGGFAFLVLNKGPVAIDYRLQLSHLGVSPADGAPCALTLTDVWSGKTQVVDAAGAVAARIEPHDNLMLRAAPTRCAALTPTGQVTVAQAAFGTPPLCLQADVAGEVSIGSCSGSARQQWRMQADGHIRLADAATCLSVAAGGQAKASACADTPEQRFAYHRSGALGLGGGQCLAVQAEKVGHGGLLGQEGAHLHSAACAQADPNQVFSAPHRASPPA